MRLGLIVPSSNTVMEPDLHRELGSVATISTARIFLKDVTREAEIRMLEEDLPKASALIATTAPDVVVFGCTSAGALGTLAHDEGIAKRIAETTGAKTVTVIQAVLAELISIRPRKLAVFTPYVEDLTASVGRSLAEGGYPPVKTAGMGMQANLDIGRVSPEAILSFVEDQLAGIAPDCVFLSCTNWRAMETMERLSARLEIPVVSSNAAAVKFVRKLI